MRPACRLGLVLLTISCLLATLSCNGTDAVLDSGASNAEATTRFGVHGEIPIQEGLALGADPPTISLDPCAPDAPRDPVTNDLTGSAALGAVVRDADLRPIPDVPVIFHASAGALRSDGQPVLTDENGLAQDVLMVDEDEAGDVEVTATTQTLFASLTVPVVVVPKPPVTLTLDPSELWPPNHRLREVTVAFPGLECHPGTTFVLESVTSNEADDGNGDGNTDGDIQGVELGTPDTSFLLRAERAGGGSGRIYSIVYALTNEPGATRRLDATVTVPHDQGH